MAANVSVYAKSPSKVYLVTSQLSPIWSYKPFVETTNSIVHFASSAPNEAPNTMLLKGPPFVAVPIIPASFVVHLGVFPLVTS